VQSAFRGFFVFAVDKRPILGRHIAFILFATLVGVMKQKKEDAGKSTSNGCKNSPPGNAKSLAQVTSVSCLAPSTTLH